jgi:hypothetical protein
LRADIQAKRIFMVNPEQPDEERSRKLRELEGKNIEYYSVMLAAYMASRSEVNKAIFAFSVSAIGLLFAMAEKVKNENFGIVFLYLLSIGLFFGAAILSLFIFSAISQTIEDRIRSNIDEAREFRLKNYAYVNYVLFGFGVFCSILTIWAYVINYFI